MSKAPAPENQAVFLNFSFFKVDPKWRWLNEIGKDEAAKEFANLVEVANTKIKVRVYSTLGLREDADLMLWMISDSMEKTQVMTSKVYSTVVGKYLTQSYVFLSAARPSVYSSKLTPGFMTDAQPMKYCIVYPFVKSREWYLLPFEERKKMMDEHIKVGKKFPQVRLNTTSSFGLDDQDFMLAFETEDLMAFQELIMQLRETKVSKYVVRDTPMIVCVYKGVEDIIKSLG
ncbi:MAG: chlorite dismutase family protein [Thaumarchaeota archaeon]|nr:MAG: chlorite dismutase family protein [Nitrososphaerota archaeon]